MTLRFRIILCAALPLILCAGPAAAQSDLTGAVDAWLTSPHADTDAEAFAHWDEEGAVPEDCAVSHSGAGLRDFLGADGSAAGTLEGPAPIRSAVGCTVCHSSQAESLSQATFPSGVTVDHAGADAVCFICHMGRKSGDSVGAPLAEFDADAVIEGQYFVNIHYKAAAATLYGAVARGGYHYPDKRYAGRFTHVSGFTTCADCHEPHTTQVRDDECVRCHRPRDRAERLAERIARAHDALGRAIADYAAAGGFPLVYAGDAYPYFFEDTDADGQADAEETRYPNRYAHWTPRLLRAAYNFQLVEKDTGAHAHNPRYVLQLLLDSLESLGERVDVPDDLGPRPR